MANEHPPGQEGPPQGSQEFTIAHSKALVPLLAFSGATVLLIVISIIRAEPFVPAEGAIANKAYRPANFPAVFAVDEALVGLEGKAPGEKGALYPVPPPPFSKDAFPCMDCHETLDPDPTRRKLVEAHDEIELRHDEEHRWCLDCHDAKDRNRLKLASGELIEFTESYRLCGQCHGTQFRDWRTGIHGKRTGYWNGPKRYMLCVACHWPHAPHFAPLEPLPPPVRPQFARNALPGETRGTTPAAEGDKEGAHGNP